MSRAAAIALALVLLAGVADAQPRDVAKADALFREGRNLMKRGAFETACPKLEESYRLDPAAGTGINLGDCFEKRGKVASALLAYQAARALLQPGDPRIGPVEKEIATLEKRTPRLTIKLAPGAPEGTTVKRDGREVEASKLGVPVAVNPGKLTVVVSAPGRDTTVFRVSLVEGKSRELEVGPGEATAGVPDGSAALPSERGGRRAHTAGASGSSPGSSQRAWGYGFLGLAGAAGLTAAVFWGLAVGTHGEPCPGDDCAALNDKEQNQRNVATVAGIVGVAAAVGGFSLLLSAPDGPGTAGLRTAPSVGDNTWAIKLGGVW